MMFDGEEMDNGTGGDAGMPAMPAAPAEPAEGGDDNAGDMGGTEQGGL